MRKTSALEETLFLAGFIAFFFAMYVALQHLLLPHNYNKMIVLVLTSIVVALVAIFMRYWLFLRRGGPS